MIRSFIKTVVSKYKQFKLKKVSNEKTSGYFGNYISNCDLHWLWRCRKKSGERRSSKLDISSGLISDCKIVTIELDHIKHEYIVYSRCIVHYPECSFCKAKNDIRNYKNMKDFDPWFDNDDSWKTNTYSKMNPAIMYTVFKDSKLDISELRTDVFIDLVNYCKRHNIKDPRFDIETYKGK